MEENFSPVKRGSEKSFGIVFFIAFFIFGIYDFNYSFFDFFFFFISLIFLILAFTKPSILKFLNVLWFNIGIKLGGIVAPLVMMLVYLIGIIPVALLVKLFQADLLKLKTKKNVESFWISRRNKLESMKKQY